MDAWQPFFGAQVSASAALTGLLVVAISASRDRILTSPELLWRACEALIGPLSVLTLGSAMLIPRQPAPALGAEALGVGMVCLGAPLAIRLRTLRGSALTLMRKAGRAALTGCVGAPFTVCGAFVALHAPGAIYWFACGAVLSLTAGVVASWVLLIEIAR